MRSEILLVSAGVGLALVIAEISCRVLGLGHLNAPVVPSETVHHAHPEDFTFVAYDPRHEYGGFSVYYDHNGFRTFMPGSKASPSTGTRTVMLLGDSFTEALQVPYEKSFAGQLQLCAKPGVQVINAAVSSYSPVLYEIQWHTKLQSFNPVHMILQLYSNDPGDDLKYLESAIRDEQGIVRAVPNRSLFHSLASLGRVSYLLRFLRSRYMIFRERRSRAPENDALVVGGYIEENPELNSEHISAVLRLAESIAKTGSRLTVVVIPSKYRIVHRQQPHAQDFDRKWLELGKSRGLNFIDLWPALNTAQARGAGVFFDHDIHLTSYGHAAVAETLAQNLPNYFYPEDCLYPRDPAGDPPPS